MIRNCCGGRKPVRVAIATDPCKRIKGSGESMSGHLKTPARSLIVLLASVCIGSGCHGTARRTISGSTASSSGEPILHSEVTVPGPESAAASESSSGVTIVEPANPSSAGAGDSLTWVDRHPLLRKPQQYYESTKSNKLVKTAAATFVGVPVGFVGELKQIVVGKPSSATY